MAADNVSLIIRERDPLNLEFPFDKLDSFITPAESFYVRNHFSVPDLKSDSYELSVEGAVESALRLRLDEVRAMPAQTVVATLECAGNSRVFLVPQHSGAQWELGAIGNAEWTGVPLGYLLEHAGLKAGVCEIVLEGADRGKPKEMPKPPGEIAFARSLPLGKALAPEVLVAYQMNGRDLPPEHGFPVRAVVPGYYGMASVKWLTRIAAVEKPFTGYWQTSDYAFWDHVNGNPVRRGLSEIKLKSAIVRPGMYEVVQAETTYSMVGAAWTGIGEIAEIEVSADDGSTWHSAQFIDPVQPFAWRRWKYEWLTPSQPGRYVLKSRAWDRQGRTQPSEHDENYGGYAIHHTLAIQVTVR